MMLATQKREFKQNSKQESERGFVLATALVMLSLLTLLAVAMYYNSKSATQISSTAQHSTEGHYYAETAVNYMLWAYNNDAEFDSYDYGSGALFGSNEPAKAANASEVGDKEELSQYVWAPGPTEISDTSAKGICDSAAGFPCQVLYFDNTPMGSRAVCTEYVDRGAIPNMLNPHVIDPSVTDPFPTCINLWASPADRYAPSLYQISTRLPRYIVLEIDSSGVITPSIPALPHQIPPVPGTDVPSNGAIAWLTTGNLMMDFEVDPSINCINSTPSDAKGCDKNRATSVNSDGWLRSNGDTVTYPNQEDQYGVVVYAIGYVNGRPSSIIRAQIQ